jgi:hypothetical protein
VPNEHDDNPASISSDIGRLRQEANVLYEKLQKNIATAHQALDMPSRYFPNGVAGRTFALEQAIRDIREYDAIRWKLSGLLARQLGETPDTTP